MARNTIFASVVIYVVGLVLVTTAVAQEPQAVAPPPPADKGDGSLVYEVIQVKGKVRVAQTGTDPKATEGWSYVKVGDTLGVGLQINVPFRGAVKLVARPADPPTVIMIKRSSLVSISDLSLQGGVATSRIKIAYGAVRAGVAEGTTRSDMEIEAPVATLSKRGTDYFEFEYRNRRFRMSLSDQGRGLIRAIQMQSTAFGALRRMRTRSLTPGRFVTQRMARVIDNVQFDRKINVNDVFGLGKLDELFAMFNDHGIGFLLPQGGNPVHYLDTPTADGRIGETPDFDPGTGGPGMDLLQPAFQQILRQRSGDFGIGQGNVPSVHGLGAGSRLQRVKDAQRIRAKQDTLRRQGRKR